MLGGRDHNKKKKLLEIVEMSCNLSNLRELLTHFSYIYVCVFFKEGRNTK